MNIRVKTASLFFLLLPISSAYAESSSGSMARSCSGTVLFCQGSSCSNQSFYIYGYQYASVTDGRINNENHNINVSGILGDASDYRPLPYAERQYVIHSRPGMDIALPWQSDSGIYMRQTNSNNIGWHLLCPGDSPTAPPPGALAEPNPSFSESGSMSRSCSANMLRYCEGTSCSNSYFYIYAYQYASVSNGRLSSESHSLSASGILEGDYTVMGLHGRAVAHHGPKFDVYIPWRDDLPITARQSDGRGSSSGVQVLCPP